MDAQGFNESGGFEFVDMDNNNTPNLLGEESNTLNANYFESLRMGGFTPGGPFSFRSGLIPSVLTPGMNDGSYFQQNSTSQGDWNNFGHPQQSFNEQSEYPFGIQQQFQQLEVNPAAVMGPQFADGLPAIKDFATTAQAQVAEAVPIDPSLESDGPEERKQAEYIPRPKKKRKSKKMPLTQEQEEEKRDQFLKRNRDAASKCRRRKKAWTDDLENKSKSLKAAQNFMKQVAAGLEEEVRALLQMAYDHRACGCPKIDEHLREHEIRIRSNSIHSAQKMSRTHSQNSIIEMMASPHTRSDWVSGSPSQSLPGSEPASPAAKFNPSPLPNAANPHVRMSSEAIREYNRAQKELKLNQPKMSCENYAQQMPHQNVEEQMSHQGGLPKVTPQSARSQMSRQNSNNTDSGFSEMESPENKGNSVPPTMMMMGNQRVFPVMAPQAQDDKSLSGLNNPQDYLQRQGMPIGQPEPLYTDGFEFV